MREINPHYTFPASPPQSSPHAEHGGSLQPSALPKPTSLGLSPQPRGRRHQHRRSGAVSEDLSAADIAIWAHAPTQPLQSPAPSIKPVSLAKPVEQAAEVPDILFPEPQDSVLSSPHVQRVVPATMRVVGEPGELTQPVNTDLSSESSANADLVSTDSIILVPSQTSAKNPSLLKPRRSRSSSSMDSAAANSSPTKSKKKRRSFVSLFKKSSPPLSSGSGVSAFSTGSTLSTTSVAETSLENPSTSTVGLSSSAALPFASSTFQTSPQTSISSAEERESVRNEEERDQDMEGDSTLVAPPIVVPIASLNSIASVPHTPVFGADDFDGLPRIDLNEALSCSFDHRMRAPDPPGSPFSRKSCIQPVLEEEDESDGSCVQLGRAGSTRSYADRISLDRASLDRASLDRSSSDRPISFRRPKSAMTQDTSLPKSPRSQSQPSPPLLRVKNARPAYDQVSSLSILDPNPQAQPAAQSKQQQPLATVSPQPSNQQQFKLAQLNQESPQRILPQHQPKPSQHQQHNASAQQRISGPLRQSSQNTFQEKQQSRPQPQLSTEPIHSQPRGHARKRSLLDRIMGR